METSSIFEEIKKLTRCERYLIAVLCYINIINYIDRFGIAAILIIIQDNFNISDDKAGLLQTVLLICLTIGAPIFGYCGDRFSRKILIMSCLFVWICSAASVALTKRFEYLLICRAFLGISQAGFTVIAPTIISDIALRGVRTIALSLFYFGIPMGVGLGYVLVGNIAHFTGNWRYGLFGGPILAMFGAIALVFANFPNRGEKEAAEVDGNLLVSTTYYKDIWYLIKVPSFVTATVAFTCVCFTLGGVSWWMPKVLNVGFRLIEDNPNGNIEMISTWLGVLTISTGTLGVIVGLVLSRLLRKRFPNCDPIICGSGVLIALPFMVSTLYIANKSQILTFVFLFFSELNLCLNWALLVDIILYTIVPSRRTSAHGINIFITHIFGDCISPYIVGSLSEYFKGIMKYQNGTFVLPLFIEDQANVKLISQEFYSMQMGLFLVIFMLLFGAFFFFLTAYFVVNDAKKVQIAIESGRSI